MQNPSRPICDYEGSNYQQRFWEDGDREYEDLSEAIALRRLLPPGGRHLLEVGAGAGRNTPRYQGFAQITLLDFARSQLEQARARLGASERYQYVAADVYKLPFAPGVFDGATMIRTLHHLVDPQAALLQIRQTLAPQAVFILEYANKQNLKAIGRWLLHRQAWNPFQVQAVEFAPLNFDFHPRAVRRWLELSGFRVQRQRMVSIFRTAALKRLVPARTLATLEQLGQWMGTWLQLSPSMFVRCLASGADKPQVQGRFWRCPTCGSLDLQHGQAGLVCASCRRLWPLQNGIYDFREPGQDPQAVPVL